MKKKNRRIIRLLACTIAVMLACTYISMQVYRHSLPIVEIGEIAAGTVKRTYTMEGVFRYQNVQDILFPIPVLVEEIYVRAGEAVADGMEILKLDTEYLYIQMLEMELSLEEMKEQEEKENDERRREILAYGRQKKEAEYQKLRELYEADGIVYTSCWGEVRGGIYGSRSR